MTSDCGTWVLEALDERCDPDGTGRNGEGSLWSSFNALQYEASKDTDYTGDEIRHSLERLERVGLVFNWHGLLVPAEDDYLRAVCREEAQAREHVRRILIGKSNTTIAAL